MKKVKILTYNKAGFDKAVKHAKALGIIPASETHTFNPDKTSVVLTVTGGMKLAKSRAGYTPKKDPYAAIITLVDFQGCNHINELTANKPGVSGVPKAECDEKAIKAASTGYDNGFDVGEQVGYDNGYDDGTTDASPQTTLKCVEVNVLTQNPIVFNSMGIPFFKSNGVEIVENDDKLYTLDVTSNKATEFTAAAVSAQAKKDLLEGEDTIYTQFSKNFELIDSIRYEKVLVDETTEA